MLYRMRRHYQCPSCLQKYKTLHPLADGFQAKTALQHLLAHPAAAHLANSSKFLLCRWHLLHLSIIGSLPIVCPVFVNF